MDKLNALDMFKFFLKNNPDTTVTYSSYKHALSEFHKKAVQMILCGKTFYMGHKLGLIRIKKVERNFDKPSINWGETNKLKAEGINKHVYFTDEYWYRWYWNKSRASLKNKSVYKFSPTEGSKGNKKKLVQTIKMDQFAHLNFVQ